MSEIRVEELTIKLSRQEARNIAYAIKSSLIKSIDEHYCRFPEDPGLIDEQNKDLFNIMNDLMTVSEGRSNMYLDREVRDYLKGKLNQLSSQLTNKEGIENDN